MSTATTPTTTLRADAARNRELVLAAAERLLAARGVDVSMQEIAAEAGVGVGTVFRRFPTKDDLVVAVLLERMEDVATLAASAVEDSVDDPWAAFATFFVGTTELHARHRGLMESIGSTHGACAALAEVRGRLVQHLRLLVDRAIASGDLRPDVVAEDIPVLQCAISRTSCMPVAASEPEAWRRACALLLDGMRAGAASATLEPTLPTFEQLAGACRA